MARMATGVRKRADGTLEKRFTIEGKRYSVYGRTNKEITEKELELRKKLSEGLYVKNSKVTLDKYFEEWKAGRRNTTKGNTLKTYSSYYYNHVSPVLGKKKVQDIERREIKNLQGRLMKELSANTVNTAMKVVTAVFNDAVKDEIIARNPAAEIGALKSEKKAVQTIHRALTEEEQIAFMSEAKEEHLYNFYALLLSTGMRPGEAAALTWDDIDEEKGVIHVRSTVTFTEDGKRVTGTPKSEAGYRDVPIIPTARAALNAQRGNYIQFKTRRVFSSVYGRMVDTATVNRSIQHVLKRLSAKGIEIPRFTAHAFRDTFATRFIEQGGQPQTLKVILGHNSLAMTMDLYAHVLPDFKNDEMQRVNIRLA